MKIKRVATHCDRCRLAESVSVDVTRYLRHKYRIRGTGRLDTACDASSRQTYIELLESAAPDSGVSQWIREKGAGLFHICFEVEDIDGALMELKAKGIKLRDEKPRIGHAGARIAFIDPASTGNVLIELAELPSGHSS